MSKKIVYFDKDRIEEFKQRILVHGVDNAIKDIATEIDTDQSIVDRAERYSHLINKNDEMREFFAYKEGATEQDLISKAREKEFQDTLSTFETHHCGNSLTEKEIEYDHCLKCGEYLQED